MLARLTEINGVKYATGLAWESFDYDGSKRLDMEINLIAKKAGKDWGCKVLHVGDRKQIGFGTKELKGYVSLGSVLTRTSYKELLYIKRLSDDEFYACYLDDKGLVLADHEGVFDPTGLINMINTINMATGQLSIGVSSEDQTAIFDDDDDYQFKIISFEEITKNFRKTPDDIIDKIVQENKKLKYIFIGVVAIGIAGACYFMFSKPKPEYDEIVNHEIGGQLDRKAAFLTKFLGKEQEGIERNAYLNKGKMIIKNKVDTSIYNKQEIIAGIKKLYDTYPPILNEWQLNQIRFDKLKNDTDIKFSIVLKRIEDSYGYYTDAESVTRKIAEVIPLQNLKVFPADTSNNILIAEFYYKNPEKVKSDKEFEEKVDKLNKEQVAIQKSIKTAKNEIGDVELNIQENTGFFAKRFGSSLEEASSQISEKVMTESRKIDKLLKNYKELQSYTVEVPESYTAGTRMELLNLSQQNSYYQWKVEPNSLVIPEKSANDKSPNYDYYARSYDFSIISKQYNTKGIDEISTALNLLDKPYYNIYGIQYDINNEQWVIKGEMYEKK